MTVRSCIELCGGKVFYLFVVLVVSYLLRYSFKHVLTAVSTAPEAGDRMLGELAGLEWGTYRPGQYISAKLVRHTVTCAHIDPPCVVTQDDCVTI